MKRTIQIFALVLASLLLNVSVAEAAGGGRRRGGGGRPPSNFLRPIFNRAARGNISRFNKASGVRAGSSSPVLRLRGPYFRPNGNRPRPTGPRR